jgi:pantoate--beta-alanine ligase
MIVIETINDLSSHIERAKSMGQKVGFVPTMGALHPGHVDLVRQASLQTDLVVVSIFVNPTQFNNPNDLLKYPKTIEADLALLQDLADLVFVPTIDEMYPTMHTKSWDFGPLTHSLEGFYRPGHFNGVCTVVEKLFEAVRPDYAFFGKKDYQQLAVIKALVAHEQLPIQIVSCETVREEGGLALSSRNMRLSDAQRIEARLIYRTLNHMVDQKRNMSIAEMEEWGHQQFELQQALRLEYLAIVDALSFEPLKEKSPDRSAVILIAAYAGEVRLIDNLELHW